MSATYTWVNWNPHKKRYDLMIVLGVVLYIAAFNVACAVLFTGEQAISTPIVQIRALSTLALALLHIILLIGPLARFDRRFTALLYNRRHLGVTMFTVALLHAVLAIAYYGGFGGKNAILVMLAGDGSSVPFELYGFLALVILALMAVTSHDFWLANLTPQIWKWLHMGVYGAYALIITHVVLGALSSEHHPMLAILLVIGVALVGGTHVLAAMHESRSTREIASQPQQQLDGERWIDVGTPESIELNRACMVEDPETNARIAVYRHENGISAVSNVCAHQGGPLGEGQIIGGCITCPWHGYQYLPESGTSPPPYNEKIPTYVVRVVNGRVLVRAQACAPGTKITPATLTTTVARSTDNKEPTDVDS